jgi:hypothetical protein
MKTVGTGLVAHWHLCRWTQKTLVQGSAECLEAAAGLVAVLCEKHVGKHVPGSLHLSMF